MPQPIILSAYEEGSTHELNVGMARRMLVPFESPNHDDLLETHLGNQKFPVRVTKAQGESANCVVILINGLAETDVTTLDDMATRLSQLGMTSVLLPLPNHFCRFDLSSIGDSEPAIHDPYMISGENQRNDVFHQIVHRLVRIEQIWIDGFIRSMLDIERLILRLRSKNSNDPLAALARDAYVAIYGYSIGGLTALAAALSSQMARDIDSAVLVSTGASLDASNATKMLRAYLALERRKTSRQSGLQKAVDTSALDDEGRLLWRRIQRRMLNVYKERVKKGFAFQDMYERVFLSNFSLEHEHDLDAHSRKLLFVLGASDQVITPRSVWRRSSESGIAALVLPEVGHWIGEGNRDRRHWQAWADSVVPMMASFIRDHPRDLPARHVIHLLIRDIQVTKPAERFQAELFLHDVRANEIVATGLSQGTLNRWRGPDVYPEGLGILWSVFTSPTAVPTVRVISINEQTMAKGKYPHPRRSAAKLEEERVVSCFEIVVRIESTKEPLGVLAVASDVAYGDSLFSRQEGQDMLIRCAAELANCLTDATVYDELLRSAPRLTPIGDF